MTGLRGPFPHAAEGTEATVQNAGSAEPSNGSLGTPEATTVTRSVGHLRDVLGQFTTGVTVITAATEVGPVGMTANSFSSVSLEPPLVLFSVARRSQLCGPLTETGSFAVNILNAAQRDVSTRFAMPGMNRFDDTGWSPGHSGAPVLHGVLGVVECQVTAVHQGGDHLITVGEVVRADVQASCAAPLLFFRGKYRDLCSSSRRTSCSE